MFCIGPDETDIDDVQESDIDPALVTGETRELQRPVSTLVTDLDAVRDFAELPPPLIPTTTTPQGIVSDPASCFGRNNF